MMRNKAIEYIEKNLTKVDAEKIYQGMEKFLIRYELDSAKKSKLFPETILTLEELRKLNKNWACHQHLNESGGHCFPASWLKNVF